MRVAIAKSIKARGGEGLTYKSPLVQEGSGDLQEGHPSVMKGASPSAKHPLKVPFTKA